MGGAAFRSCAGRLARGLIDAHHQWAVNAFDSRSQAVRSGLEAMIGKHRRKKLERRYRDAIARMPETGEEMVEATRLAVNAIHDEPWERWW